MHYPVMTEQQVSARWKVSLNRKARVSIHVRNTCMENISFLCMSLICRLGMEQICVYGKQGRFRSAERFARHWHDITRLGASGIATLAIADGEVARAVARHKWIFFAERDSRGPIDYHEAVSGALQLVPDGEARAVLAEDCRLMAQDGLLLDEAEPFDVLMERCGIIEVEANRALPLQGPMQ